jgi:hypothetical protein
VLDLVDPTGSGGRLGGQCGNARLDKANRKNAARDHDGEIAARPGQQQPSHCRTSIGQPPLPIAFRGPWRVHGAGRHHAWGREARFRRQSAAGAVSYWKVIMSVRLNVVAFGFKGSFAKFALPEFKTL